jgi:hypothetical protein
MSKLRLVFSALGIGLAMVVLTHLASAAPLVVTMLDLMLLVMVSIPFLILAMGGISERLPWLTGLALTVAIWGYILFGNHQPTGGGRSGTGLGFGLFVLASPLLISIACIAAYAIVQRRRG